MYLGNKYVYSARRNEGSRTSTGPACGVPALSSQCGDQVERQQTSL